MNYEALYKKLINNRQKLGRPVGYSEKHHILPKCFGGSNNSENIVALTAREHFMAHRLLAKMHPTTGMVHAVFKMACINKSSDRYTVTGRVYEQLRIAHALRVSTDKVAAHKKSISLKGRKQSAEHVKARNASRKNNGDWITEATKKKIGESNTGRQGTWKGKSIPLEAVEKRKNTMIARGGWEWSEERKKAQSVRLTGRPSNKPPASEEYRQKLREEKSRRVTCPHCGKQGTMIIMPRWHFNNCKVLTQK